MLSRFASSASKIIKSSPAIRMSSVRNMSLNARQESNKQWGEFLSEMQQFRDASRKTNVNYGYTVGALALAGGGALYYYSGTKADIGTDNVQKRIRDTYGYVLGGLGLTAVSSAVLFKTPIVRKIIQGNQWGVLAGSLCAIFPFMIGMHVLKDHPESTVARHVSWAGFNIALAATLTPIGFLGGPLIAQAALTTGGIMGGLSLAAVSMPYDSYRPYYSYLGIGLGGMVAAGIGYMIFPIPALYNFVTYGGLVLFSGLTVADTQKLIDNAKNIQDFDPMTESLSLYLDAINMFIRIADILYKAQAGSTGKKKLTDDKKID
jgi:FtsH-binding integral membrane protein